jgi:hypothetical protein
MIHNYRSKLGERICVSAGASQFEAAVTVPLSHPAMDRNP